MLKVVKVEKGDVATVNYILDHIVEEPIPKPSANHLKELLNDERTYLFVVILDDEIIGYALAYRFPSWHTSGYLAYLYDIEVSEKHRRKGAGRLLIETVLAHLKSEGVTEMWLGTATDNTEGQALFSSTGGITSEETFIDFTYFL